MLRENPVLEYSSYGKVVLGIDKTVKFYLDGRLEVILKGYKPTLESMDRRIELLTPQEQVISYADRLVQAGFFDLEESTKPDLSIDGLILRLYDVGSILPRDVYFKLLDDINSIVERRKIHGETIEEINSIPTQYLRLNYLGKSKELKWMFPQDIPESIWLIVKELEDLTEQYLQNKNN